MEEWYEAISRDIWTRPLVLQHKGVKESRGGTWWERVVSWWRGGYCKLKQL